MFCRKTLNDIYEYDYSRQINPEGIFMPNFLYESGLPENIFANTATLSYIDGLYFSRSGDKYISKMVENYYNALNDKVVLSTRISHILKALYLNQWKRLFEIYSLEYAPIENYNMIEQMINDITSHLHGKSSTRSFTNRETEHVHGESETKSFTNRETEHINGKIETLSFTGREREVERIPDLTREQKNQINGFNSLTAVDSGNTTETETGNDTTTTTERGIETRANTGTDTDKEKGSETLAHTGTDIDKEKGSETLADSGTDTDTRNYRLTRSGNIGVTTAQQMMTQEVDFWATYEIFDKIIFPDMDKLLTLPIY